MRTHANVHENEDAENPPTSGSISSRAVETNDEREPKQQELNTSSTSTGSLPSSLGSAAAGSVTFWSLCL
eukprot:COSAG02_NODE_9594_length_2167_cov_4.711799_1_plen_69_part_10